MTGSRIVLTENRVEVDGPLRIRFLCRERRCNSRFTKRAIKYLWRVENTDYGKRPILEPKWNRKLRKIVLKRRGPK